MMWKEEGKTPIKPSKNREKVWAATWVVKPFSLTHFQIAKNFTLGHTLR